MVLVRQSKTMYCTIHLLYNSSTIILSNFLDTKDLL